jgi:hypothetical protein
VRRSVRLALPVITLLVAVAAAAVPARPGVAAAPPTHELSVTGTGVGSYPAFDPAVERYAVTTTAATGGSVTVHASTSDAAGVVRVDGRVIAGDTAVVSGLAAGDEVSVIFEDSAGTDVHSLIYLPAGFPALEVVQSSPGVAAGQVGLTLSDIFTTGTRFVTTVDRNGVPTHVLAVPGDRGVFDLKDQPDGSITFSETTSTPGRTGEAVVVLDQHWQEVGRRETVAGLVNTDLHDSILLPDGTAYLMAYEPDGAGEVDSVIQEIDPSGQQAFRWSSDGLQFESVAAVPSNSQPWDYAHMNSMQVLSDGDVIASFRHLSAVLRIATRAHDGYQPGDIVWRLGGRASDFTFVDDPYGGPCAQHTASLLPNGHVLVFDDGSDAGLSKPLCVDPADPSGPPVTRQQSRVAEYELDPVNHTATLVWSYVPTGWYSWFMGSAARLANGDTLVGWAAETDALATEVAPNGDLLWQLRLADPKPVPPLISYRASLMTGSDADLPVVSASVPADGVHYAVGQQVAADFTCSDRGGSSLRTCAGDVRPGGLLDTSTPGPHTLRLVATDGAGNTTTVTRSYTVDASYQPRWAKGAVRRTLEGQRVGTRVRLVNDGTYADRFALEGTGANAGFTVTYQVGHKDVTRAVRRGRFRTEVLQPGESLVLRVVVARTDRTRPGAHRSFKVLATSVADSARRDAVRVVVRVP